MNSEIHPWNFVVLNFILMFTSSGVPPRYHDDVVWMLLRLELIDALIVSLLLIESVTNLLMVSSLKGEKRQKINTRD